MTGSAGSAAEMPRRRSPFWGRALFVLLMLGLTGVFVSLGLWQMDRLEEKQALVAAVASRMDGPPVPLPPVAEWVGFDAEVFDYRPVVATGRFIHGQTVLVFTGLTSPRGQYDGAGYWVLAPFALAGGGTVFVNRGFVPQRLARSYAAGGAGPQGEVTLTGIARRSEAASGFTPTPDPAQRIEYVRNVDRLGVLTSPELAPFAPMYIDLPATAPGALPQGGETVLSFPNNHFGYALTWFGFAIITPVMLLFWLVRQLRPASEP